MPPNNDKAQSNLYEKEDMPKNQFLLTIHKRENNSAFKKALNNAYFLSTVLFDRNT